LSAAIAGTCILAELIRLDGAGYSPAANDPSYPQKLQNTEKKLNAPAGESQ